MHIISAGLLGRDILGDSRAMLRVLGGGDSLLTGAENDRHLVKKRLGTASTHHWLVATIVDKEVVVVEDLEGDDAIDCDI